MDKTYTGSCHCGSISIRLTLSWPLDSVPVRACDCTFCRAHGARTVTDPDGHVEIEFRDDANAIGYRFGLNTADYLVCRECGVYVAAMCETEYGLRATVNVNALLNWASFDLHPQSVNYDRETAASRRARRGRRWTPATVK